jgi:Calponin homology (CH) domain
MVLDDGQIILESFPSLFQAKMEVEDLFVDLADGVKLLKLLEIISGEKLGKPNNGRMRVHKIENLNKSLAFLHTKVSYCLLFTSFSL